ncbi:MAG: tetratricopeptide repeat protein, partial [Planctomycetota bacterium]
RTKAPIHVWRAPVLQSTVGATVLVPAISGPKDVSSGIQRQLIATAPSNVGRSTTLIDPDELTHMGENKIALVSFDEQDPSDLVVSHQARQADADFILQGEILLDRRPGPNEHGSDQAPNARRLLCSWRLVPTSDTAAQNANGSPMGEPVAFSLDQAIDKYPDLALARDPDAALQAAVVRGSLELITPWVDRERIQLDVPFGMLGSRTIRKANGLARQGRWAEAEQLWQEAHDRFPWSSAASHNLALASVAKQDFSAARTLARRAVRLKPTRRHQRTLAWVEQTQRAYHDAFQLADPPEGWSITRSATASNRNEFPNGNDGG